MWPSNKPRCADELKWSDNRLHILGFKKRIINNLQSWVDGREHYIVYADQRLVGRINFSIWKKPLPKRPTTNIYRYKKGQFYLLDTWKNDLQSKYESRLQVIS